MNFLVPIPDIEKDSKFDKYILSIKRPVWGVSDRLKATFDKMSVGDLVFFYHQKEIISIGDVRSTETNKEYSLLHFGTNLHKSGELITYPHLIYFSKIYPCKLDFESLKIELGYSDKYYVRRLTPIYKALKVSKELSVEENISEWQKRYSKT